LIGAKGSIQPEDSSGKLFGAILAVLILAQWGAGLFYAPVDALQGQVYRIIFLHVPCAFTAFFSAFILFIYSILALRSKNESHQQVCKATAEVGLIFTALTLITGSIWGKPTWGVWWTWDARLTTTLLLAILYAGYLLLYASLEPGPGRTKACAILGILISADVPVIYQSVNWWRTLHQPQSMLRPGGATMDPAILWTVVSGILIMVLFSIWLIMQRKINIALQDELETQSFQQLK
jgi:heme exporter protein C